MTSRLDRAPDPTHPPFVRRRRPVPTWAGWAVAALVFAAVAPLLGRLELANGIEVLHAATVLEMRRPGGSWLTPTLNGTPRVKKPPLPAWAGAAAVTDATLAGVAAADPAARAAGFDRLSWEIRWPALLAGCLALAATFDLGRTVGGRRVGLAAAVVAGTSLLFLRFVRLASTDVHLFFWVATASALFARAALRGQRWAVVAAGAAVGLGVMCKGPVAVLQTVVPLGVWAAWGWWAGRGTRIDVLQDHAAEPRLSPLPPGEVVAASAAAGEGERRTGFVQPGPVVGEPEAASTFALTPTLSRGERGRDRPARRPPTFSPRTLGWAALAFLAVALPWPILVAASNRQALGEWWREITREGATDHEYGPFYSYLSLLPNLLPWLPACGLGLWLTFRRQARWAAGGGRERGYLLALLWLAIPVLVMSCVRDKSERYLLPVLPAAAVLGGRGLVAIVAGARRGRPAAGVWLAAHLILVAVLAVALPVAGMLPKVLARAGGGAWYRPVAGGLALAVAVAAAVGMFVLARRRRPTAALGVAAVAMLGTNALLLWGYADAPAGRSEMRPIAERILVERPGATVGYADPGGKPGEPGKPMPPDLSIYLDRVVRPLDATRRRGEPDPDVVVALQREHQPPPRLEGYRSFAAEPYGKRFWHAMAREP